MRDSISKDQRKTVVEKPMRQGKSGPIVPMTQPIPGKLPITQPIPGKLPIKEKL